MTPLIDVVFLLLIFFMLSTSFVRTESLELMLPQGGSGQPASESKLLQVYVTSDDYMYVGRQPVSEGQLVKVLKQTVAAYPEVNILLLSGPGVTVQQLVKVMDRINLAGAHNLSVANWEPKPAAATQSAVDPQKVKE